jgi:LEA14-like dessication related protein
MKRTLFFTAILTLTSCKISSPTFKYLDQWQIGNVSSSNITLTNTAYFYNPNSVHGLKINNVSINVMANGKKLGTVSSASSSVVIPNMSDFSIPLRLSIDPKDLLGNITDILGAALGKSIDLRCVGNIGVGFSVINKNISIDQTLPVSLSAVIK